MNDISYMHTALALARRGLGRTVPNPSVGCVIVRDGIIWGRGRTGDGGRPHAETEALKQAGARAKGATVYVSLEPCSHQGQTGPCAQALIDAGVKRVVVACTDPDPRVSGRGIQMLAAAGIEVVAGVLEEEAMALNKGFMLRITESRPLVTLKLATSRDGKIAPLNGDPLWITGDAARRHVHLERSRHDAILVGIGTIIKDNPLLTTRFEGITHEPVRIVLDSHLKLPLESKILKGARAGSLFVFHRDDPDNKAVALEKAGVRLFPLSSLRAERSNPEGEQVTDWIASSPRIKSGAPRNDVEEILKILGREGITRLLVEGGGKVHASFVRAGIGDRLLWYRAPTDMGEGIPAFEGMAKDDILKTLGLKAAGTRVLGEDLLEIFKR